MPRNVGRRITGSLLFLVVTASALVVGAQPAAAAAAPQACQTVSIIGLRGSGQTSGYGPEVDATARALQTKLTAANHSVALLPVDYTAASTDLLKPNNVDWPFKTRAYLASVNLGAGVLYTTMDLRAKKCPNEKFVLLGYSQGSMAIRPGLRTMANRGETGLLGHVSAIGLIADPTKNANEPNIAGAPPLSRGIATQFRVAGAPVAIPNQLIGLATNACRYRDLVCDFSSAATTAVHTSYTSTSFLGLLAETLAPRVLNRTAPSPAPTPPGQGTPQPPPAQPTFTVMNTSETPPDGVWFRNSPSTADTDRITGHGVYANDRVQLQCHASGDAVGQFNNRLWYRVVNLTRPTVPGSGAPNNGFLNAHYINDGQAANQAVSTVPAC